MLARRLADVVSPRADEHARLVALDAAQAAGGAHPAGPGPVVHVVGDDLVGGTGGDAAGDAIIQARQEGGDLRTVHVAEDDDSPGIDEVLPARQVVHDAGARMHAGGQGNQFVLAGLAVFLIPVVLGDDDHPQPGEVDGVGPRTDARGELFMPLPKAPYMMTVTAPAGTPLGTTRHSSARSVLLKASETSAVV